MTPEQTTRFEAWARSQGHCTRKERGRYAEGVVNKMRDAWMQARKGGQP